MGKQVNRVVIMCKWKSSRIGAALEEEEFRCVGGTELCKALLKRKRALKIMHFKESQWRVVKHRSAIFTEHGVSKQAGNCTLNLLKSEQVNRNASTEGVAVVKAREDNCMDDGGIAVVGKRQWLTLPILPR